jgi:DNA helicase II / ATP-dependent DNA helicase PcrA
VSPQYIDEYVARYNPIILRWNRQANEEICQGRLTYNFGEAKGIGFDRVLILPTERYAKFLSGDHSAFGNNDSDGARNKLYVAITRARYSVAFLLDCSSTLLSGIEVWQP